MARLFRRDPDAIFTAFHSDHIIANLDAFDAAVRLAGRLAADGPIVNVGATPTYPETGYGYVERGELIEGENGVAAFRVVRFVEKPDAATAAEYVRAGTFLWNVGMFTWRASVVRDLLRQHLPGSVERFERVDRALESDPEAALATFAELPNVAVDYAILEKATDRIVIEADLGWLDIGDWAAVYGATAAKDQDGNALSDSGLAIDSRGSYLWSSRPGKVVAAIGLHDMVVVDTEDALLVAPRGRAQDVRRVIEELKRRGLGSHL